MLAFASLLLSFYWDAPPFNMVVPLLAGLAYFIFSIFSAVKVAKTYHTLDEKPKRITSFLFYPVIAVGGALMGLLIASIFDNFETYNVPSVSMADTIVIGDKVICDESAYDDSDPQRGDLMVFFSPSDKTTKYIKRCVAVGGDFIQIDKKNLFVNGRQVALPPTGLHRDPDVDPRRDDFGPYQFPQEATSCSAITATIRTTRATLGQLTGD
ncbi:MAG: signal peptidase I [bacterium]|nr:signal peptidase I [bacterium]